MPEAGLFNALKTPEPDAIQPHGWLIVCDSRAVTVLRHSSNLASLFPEWGAPFIGASINELLSADTAHDLRNALTRFAGPARPALLRDRHFPGCDAAFDVTTFPAGEETLIEIEKTAAAGDRAPFDRTRAMVDRIAQASDVAKLLLSASRVIFSVLQYDCVSIVHRNGDGAAQVLAEQQSHDLDLGGSAHALRAYPPPPTLDEKLRVIVDEAAAPALILSDAAAGPPDLTRAHLRAASDQERAALRSGGFAASLAVALTVDGALWGQALCLNRAPRDPPMDLRASVEMFGDFLSLKLQTLLHKRALAAADRPPGQGAA
jgi:light-regulated signal transduction histidine kinase (bacteriophytochrome)